MGSARSPQLSPQLERIDQQLREASGRARALFEGLTREQMTHRPDAVQWSIADCVAHLTITTHAYLPLLRAALADARERGLIGNGPFKMDLAGRILRWLSEPPPKLKSRTPTRFQPVDLEEPEGVLLNFLESQQQLMGMLEQAAGLRLDASKIASPFDQRVKYNVYSCFEILPAHERRHLWQAEQVKRALLRPNAR